MVFVALCTYNGEKFLSEQLDSILHQSEKVDEIVVCDDQSTDNTWKILENYQKKYPEIIQIHRNNQNLGYVKNFEKAILLCNGDLIFLADQDDFWFPEKVQVVKNELLKNPNKTVICHDLRLSDQPENDQATYWKKMEFNPRLNNAEILKKILLTGNIFPGMSMAITASAKKRFLPFQKIDNIIIHDFELMIQSLKNDEFLQINQVLGMYRVHPQQNIGFNDRKTDNITSNQLYQKFLGIETIQTLVAKFGLSADLISDYKKHASEYYERYLQQFSFIRRIWIDFKTKYYYKIKF